MEKKTTLIMLPQPILVTDEPLRIGQLCYGDDINNSNQTTIHQAGSHDVANKYPRVIAGKIGLPKLELSYSVAERIAKETGWVDVYKLAVDLGLKHYIAGNYDFENGVRKGVLEYQSLNEKKYSLSEMEGFTKWLDENWRRGKGKKGSGWFHVGDFYKQSKPIMTKDLMSKYIDSISKPKEYQVEVEMEDMLQTRHGDQWYDLPNQKEGREPDGIYQTVKRIKITNNTIKVIKIVE